MQNKYFNISLFSIFLTINFFLFIAALVTYFNVTNPKIEGLLGGLSVALFISVLQHLFAQKKYKEIDRLRKLGVKKIIPTRDDQQLYSGIIENSKHVVTLMGNTAVRFFNDFAGTNRPDKQVLIEALKRGVEVKILLPKQKYLKDDDERAQSQISHRRMVNLAQEYNKFSFKYYDRQPSHNLMMADDDCLVGPIFPNILSKDSPAIYTGIESIFVKPYLTYYEELWSSADDTP